MYRYYTNIIKNGLIKLIKIRKSIYKMWKGLAYLSVAEDSAWHSI
jgi:hypothetical protein